METLTEIRQIEIEISAVEHGIKHTESLLLDLRVKRGALREKLEALTAVPSGDPT